MFDPQILYAALFGYALFATLGSALLAPFTRRGLDAKLFGIDDYFKAKAQNDALKAEREQANKNAAAQEAYVQKFLADLAGRGIDIYGPQTTTTSGTSSQSGTSSSQMRKHVDPRTALLLSKVIAQQEQELDRPDLYGAEQKAALARERGQMDAAQAVQVANAVGGRGLSAGQAGALRNAGAGQSLNTLLGELAKFPQLNAAARERVRAESTSTTRDLMGTDTNSQFSQTGATTGSTSAPADWMSILGITSPQARVSTKTGYSPFGEALSGAAGGAMAAYNLFGNPFANKPATPSALPTRDMTWAGMSR